MRAVVVLVLTTAVLAAGAALGVVAWQQRGGSFELELPQLELPFLEARAPVPRVIWLVRDGATLTAGPDDSTQNRSSIVAGARNKVTEVKIPPFRGGARTWRKIVSCLREQFAPFDVEIVETRPRDRGYVMAVFGGSPSLLGYGRATGGLAPYSGEVVPDPVVLIFTRALGERPRAVCEVAAMEIAHAYGLDHVYLCKDPMSYLSGCGAKRFQDRDAPCGEHKPRACGDGQPTQNSVARLRSVLGARPTAGR